MADFKRPGGFGGNKNRGGFGGGGGFNRRDGGRPSFGGKPSFGGRDGGQSEMFTATCSDCGNECQVPFRPNGSKPVYCNNCFSSKRDGYSNDFAAGAPKHRSQQPDTFSFGAPAPKQTPTQPTATAQSDKRIDELKKQVDALSAKIDKLLHIAQNGPQPKMAVAATPVSPAPAALKALPPTPKPTEKPAPQKTIKATVPAAKKTVTKAPTKKKVTAKKK